MEQINGYSNLEKYIFNKKIFKMELLSDTPIQSYTDYYHGWFLWTAWALLAFIQIASNRYFKSFWWLHMWIHRIVGFSIFCLTVGFGMKMIAYSGWLI